LEEVTVKVTIDRYYWSGQALGARPGPQRAAEQRRALTHADEFVPAAIVRAL
jgi:hypothetical protein